MAKPRSGSGRGIIDVLSVVLRTTRGERAMGSIKYHKPSGQACCYIRRKIIYLGKWPNHPSKPPIEVLRAYAAALARDCINPGEKVAPPDTRGILLSELVDKWLAWANTRYGCYKVTGGLAAAVRPLLDLYAAEMASTIGPKRVEDAQRTMAEVKGWSRQGINKATGVIRKMVAWGVAQEILHPDQLARLKAMQPLRRGATTAPESDPIEAVPLEVVRATLPHLGPTIAAMVEIQMLTGMRPGEVVSITMADIDRTNPARWVYRPLAHKMAHLGRIREVPLLKDAQAVLAPFIRLDGKPLFSPADAREAWEAGKRSRRKTKVQPSQIDRHKDDPLVAPGDAYTTASYRRAIERAGERAGVGRWSPNRLRKLAAQRVADALGLDAARALLGHVDAGITAKHYARHQLNQAASAAEVLTRNAGG
jgi:integrase